MLGTCRLGRFGLLLCLAPCFASGAEKLPLSLTVAAGSRERTDGLVQFPSALAEQDRLQIRLTETTGGKETPVAVQRDAEGGRVWWVAAGKTAAGAVRTYRLEEGVAAAKFPSVGLSVADGKLMASFLGKPLLQYAEAHVTPQAGINPKYGRSGHLHPVWTPSGSIITDEFPPDHLHQSGIFLAFTKTEFKGHEVDFWNLAGGKGRIRAAGLGDMPGGAVFGQLTARHEHVDLTQADKTVGLGEKSGGDVALYETWKVCIWPAGFASGYWLLDIDSTLTCAGDQPLKLPEYHYGGMAIRAAREWKPQQVNFLTSLGDDRLKGNHTRPKWCRMSGLVEGKPAGVTLLTHPDNFRFPEPLRIHPTMPYMVYSPSFLGDWEIRPGSAHHSRYRFVIHDSELPAEALDRLWQDYAEPLTATVAN